MTDGWTDRQTDICDSRVVFATENIIICGYVVKHVQKDEEREFRLWTIVFAIPSILFFHNTG